MPDFYGPLQLPVPVPAAGAAVSDPLLDTTLAYLKAVINTETKAAWAAVCPTRLTGAAESLPVVHTAAHDPDGASFTSAKLPALYAWREDTEPVPAFTTQAWDVVDSPIAVQWIPPPASQDKDALREPFRNAIEKAIRKAIRLGRHPAWVAAGDTYSDAPTRGSIFVRHAKVMRVRMGAFKRRPIFIEDEEGGKGTPFRSLYTTLIFREAFRIGYDNYQPNSALRGSVRVGDPQLVINQFEFRPAFSSISPAVGPIAGGTSVTLTGAQFFELDALGPITVTIGGAYASDVALVSETKITAKTPAGVAGARDVVLTLPNGLQLTRVAAFTYV